MSPSSKSEIMRGLKYSSMIQEAATNLMNNLQLITWEMNASIFLLAIHWQSDTLPASYTNGKRHTGQETHCSVTGDALPEDRRHCCPTGTHCPITGDTLPDDGGHTAR